MQVITVPIECHVDVIAADFVGLVVQRLGYIPDEVDKELEGFFGVRGGKASIAYALGVV